MLDALLNERILSLAPKHIAKAFAPETFEALGHLRVVNTLTVWDGASDKTIYGCPKVNHAFRAWHDSLHIQLNAPFNLEGEYRVAIEQARIIGSSAWEAVIIGEIVGQAEFFKKNGYFPDNQIDFMYNYLKTKGF